MSGVDDPLAGVLDARVPPEFLAALRAVMPDGVSSSAPDRTVFQPSAAPRGLTHRVDCPRRNRVLVPTFRPSAC